LAHDIGSLRYTGQFALTREDLPPRTGWISRGQLGDWTFWASSDFPVRSLICPERDEHGLLAGLAATNAGQLSDGAPFDAADLRSVVAGRWLAIEMTSTGPELQLDPFGSLACVYAPEHAVVASTAALAAEIAGIDPGRALATFQIDVQNQYFPFGLTVYPEIRRLLPNHRLDLNTMQVTRKWPNKEQPLNDTSDPLSAGLIQHIVDAIQSSVSRLFEFGDVYMPLTAGHDSRLLMASLDPRQRRHVRYYTFDYQSSSRSNRVDLYAAKVIAKRLDLDHQIIPVPETTRDEKLDYLRDIGYSGSHGKCREFRKAVSSALDLDSSLVVGFGGELGRQSLEDREQTDFTNPDVDAILRRIKLPVHQFRREAESWQTGISHLPGKTQCDLAYLENRIGSW